MCWWSYLCSPNWITYTLPNLKPFAWYCLCLDSNENTQMKQFRRNTRSRLDSQNTVSTFDGWNLPHLEYNKKYCNYRETTYQHRLVWRVGLSTHSFPLRLPFVLYTKCYIIHLFICKLCISTCIFYHVIGSIAYALFQPVCMTVEQNTAFARKNWVQRFLIVSVSQNLAAGHDGGW